MRILVVEDERALAELVEKRLTKEHYTVDVAYDGEDGLDKALSGIYDLVLLDIMLPKVDGMTILSEIRKAGLSVKVIMLTAKSALEDKLAGFSEGANDYVPKPFHIEELLARVQVQLRTKIGVDTSLSYGNVKLDEKIPAVVNTDTEEEIKINNKEFLLLEYFMMNPNQVLPKDMIFDRVWGMENDSFSNNLEAYVSFVRKKLKAIAADVTIRSVRNMGYKLESTDERT